MNLQLLSEDWLNYSSAVALQSLPDLGEGQIAFINSISKGDIEITLWLASGTIKQHVDFVESDVDRTVLTCLWSDGRATFYQDCEGVTRDVEVGDIFDFDPTELHGLIRYSTDLPPPQFLFATCDISYEVIQADLTYLYTLALQELFFGGD